MLDLTASVSPKKPAGRKMTQKVLAPPVAATTVAKKRKNEFHWCRQEQKRLEELEWRYMKDGVRKVCVNFIGNSNDSDYVCSSDD